MEGLESSMKVKEQPIEEIERLRQKVDKLRQEKTELKQAETALRESEERYQTTLENVVEGYYEVDLAGNFTFVNDAICHNLGYSRDELLGMNNRDYMDKETARKVLERFAEVYTTGQPARGFDFEVIRKDGTKLVVSSSVSLIRDSQGQPTGFQGVTMDITVRKRWEEKLRQSEARYQTILESIADGYYEVDLAGNFTFVNDAICADIGYSRDELLGMNNRDYMDKQNAKKVFERFAEVYTTGEPATEFGFEVIRKNGTKLFAACSVSLIRDSKGEPTGFRGVIRNVTEQRKAEEALRQSEKKYRTILESITDGYYEVDLAGNLTFFNDSLCRISGYSRDELLGMNYRQYMDKANASKVYQVFGRVYATGEAVGGFEFEVIRKDGTKRFVSYSVSLIRNPEGEPTGFRGTVRDITEQKKAEAEKKMLEQRAQLATRLSIVGEMASGILHEMNNPLTSVIGFAEMLAQKELPEDIKEYTRIINNEGKRVSDIANRMLVFARPQKPQRVYADINQIIETTLRLQTYEMESANIKVTTRLDPDLPWTMADPSQMQQVFVNIILNARTEMKLAHGGGKLLITTRGIDNTIQISFKDNGSGISQENMEKIFEPFFTTREPGKGTGLGLSICHEIITNHNGQIYARSKLGKGATFIVELPIIAEEQQLKQAAPATDKRTALAVAKRRN